MNERQAQMLQEINRSVNSSLVIEEIFQSLGKVLRQYLPYQEAVILVLDDTQNGIQALIRMTEAGQLQIVGEHRFSGSDPLLEQMLSFPKSLRYGDSPLPSSLVFSAQTVSAVMTPLLNKTQVTGLVAVLSDEINAFSLEHQQLLEEVAQPLSVAIQNAQLYWKTQLQAQREQGLNQLTKAIRQSLDIQTVLQIAVEQLGQITGVDRCLIRYEAPWQTSQRIEYCKLGIPPMPEEMAGFEAAVFQIRRDQTWNPFILNDVRDCSEKIAPSQLFEVNHIRSIAVFPILLKDDWVGSITLQQCETYRTWLNEDILLLQAMAEHLGIALHQAALFSEVEGQKQALENTLTELQQTQVQLIQSEKMAVLGQFVAGIAHEVNTPLGTMISNNETLQGCVDRLKQDSVQLEPLIKSMDGLLALNKLASDRIHEIVKNLRNFARLDESALKSVDLHEGIESTLLLVQHSLAPSTQVIREYGKLPLVQCYSSLLNQVFMNLLVNASHALPTDQPGTITIQTRFIPELNQVEVLFKDNGKGIQPEHLAKIFDPGFTTKGVGVGTGLGLAICYQIMQKHHGQLLVQSQVGQGTCFTVVVPVTQLGCSG